MNHWPMPRWQQLAVIVIAFIVTALPIDITGRAIDPSSTADEPGIELELDRLVDGLDEPVFLTNAGDSSGRLFVVERAGRIRVVIDGELQDEPFLDITDRVESGHEEQGLLGLAFHPEYEDTGYIYVFYTAKNWDNTVSRFSVSADPNRIDPASETVLIAIPDREPDHNGGTLTFGTNYFLYIGTGDEGGVGDSYGNAQNLQSLYGKILRVDIYAGDPYGIPGDNPFVNVPGARPEIWAYGLRDPRHFSFDWRDHLMDPLSGTMFLPDAGQSAWDEINVDLETWATAERNFGWNTMEGRHCYPTGTACATDGLDPPEVEIAHVEGCAIVGGSLYRGTASPALIGSYLFSDTCSGRIRSIR
ncbi:MAG: PQQ-dependent sugar dehydrogenase, partial [Vicinamibacterales bacterium]